MSLVVTTDHVSMIGGCATLCGVLVAVCAACWRRSSPTDKPEEVTECGVYTVSSDARLGQIETTLRPLAALHKKIDS
ncbi:unnamed protein product [Euphydryas editha]|uniref:Uncharacterized protein n=1 Tax=Euphydryas editha TaxID=104508 RepID=A0AAU9TWE9_EUPED|nr:unnamed protein product [Euphydryas editha]